MLNFVPPRPLTSTFTPDALRTRLLRKHNRRRTVALWCMIAIGLAAITLPVWFPPLWNACIWPLFEAAEGWWQS